MQWNAKINALKPYVPNPQSFDVRLDANESFLKVPQELLDEMARALQTLPLNRYPDPMAAEACAAFAEFYGVPFAHVVAGNGSDELISVIFNTFLQRGDRFATLAPDFSMYSFYGQLAEAQEIVIPKEKNFQIDIDSVIETCNNRDVKLLIFSNPCNPTSLGLTRGEVKRLVENVNAWVVLDEAYMDFWDQSLLGEYESCENLILLRTCSKALAAAGLRIGFAVSNQAVIDVMKAAKSPYNVNMLTQKMAAILLGHKHRMSHGIETVIAAKDSMVQALTELRQDCGGFELLESRTNFVSLVLEEPQKLVDFLAEQSIGVRLTGGLVRITAGNPRENERLVSAVRDYFKKGE